MTKFQILESQPYQDQTDPKKPIDKILVTFYNEQSLLDSVVLEFKSPNAVITDSDIQNALDKRSRS